VWWVWVKNWVKTIKEYGEQWIIWIIQQVILINAKERWRSINESKIKTKWKYNKVRIVNNGITIKRVSKPSKLRELLT
jgi:hypothetical protein